MKRLTNEHLAEIFCQVETVFDHSVYGSNPPWNLHEFANKNGILIEVRNIRSEGNLVKTNDGTYKILLKKRENTSTEQFFRQTYTFAHELAHWFIFKHESILATTLGETKLDSNGIEQLCDLIAAVILMPSHPLQEYFTHELTQFHPRDALMTLGHRFNANLETVTRRLQHLGLTLELPWFIGMFKFNAPRGYSKKKELKWRLVSPTLNIPRGIRLPTVIEHCGFKLHSPHSLHNAGLDTMRLAHPKGSETDWGKLIPDYSEATQPTLLGENDSPDKPWEDLNPPIGPKGGTPKCTLKLPPNKLKALSRDGSIPVATSLLSPDDMPPYPLWNNKRWRLFAYDLRKDIRKATGLQPSLLVTGYLGLARRHT